MWNLAGSGAPMLIGFISIPLLIRALGADRFGLLTLAWALVGYFGLFDFGIARALTHAIADKLGASDHDAVPQLFWGSLCLLGGLGIAAGILTMGVTPWLVGSVLHMPDSLQAEARQSFYLLGICIPFVILGAGFRGLLEAVQRFDLVNAVRIPSGILTYAGPLLVLPLSNNLASVVTVLAIGRIAACLWQLGLCFRTMPSLRKFTRFQAGTVRPLFRMGAWITVSNTVSPIMANLDKFFIAAWVSVGAVAYYATSAELITRFLVLPVAVVAVLFPAFSASSARDPKHAADLFDKSLKYLLLVLFPILLVVVAFAREALTLWLGASFAENSFVFLQWLAVGALLNGLAQIPYTFVQGVGRADLTAKLHLVELPLYVATAFFLIHRYGSIGAAVAWTARVTFDALVLFLIAGRLLRAGTIQIQPFLLIGGAALILGAGLVMTSLWAKGLWLAGGFSYLLFAGWLITADPRPRLNAWSAAAMRTPRP